jgi:hypothetical protein
MEVYMSKFSKWVSENTTGLLFAAGLGIPLLLLLFMVAQHENKVTQVTRQNPGCIYLESSRLGVDQHYMLCDGRINLVHLAGDDELPAPEAVDVIQNAVEPAPVTATTPAK